MRYRILYILIGKMIDAVNPHSYTISKGFQVVTAFPVLGVTVPRSRQVVTNGLLTRKKR